MSSNPNDDKPEEPLAEKPRRRRSYHADFASLSRDSRETDKNIETTRDASPTGQLGCCDVIMSQERCSTHSGPPARDHSHDPSAKGKGKRVAEVEIEPTPTSQRSYGSGEPELRSPNTQMTVDEVQVSKVSPMIRREALIIQQTILDRLKELTKRDLPAHVAMTCSQIVDAKKKMLTLIPQRSVDVLMDQAKKQYEKEVRQDQPDADADEDTPEPVASKRARRS